MPVDGISFRSRSAGGVRVFNTSNGEVVVSVARIEEPAGAVDEAEDDAATDGNAGGPTDGAADNDE